MKTLKRVVRKAFHPVATRLGYVPYTAPVKKPIEPPKDWYVRQAMQLMKRAGFDPKHIVDVGANHGSWTRMVLTIFPNAQYTLLEPQAWLRTSMEDLLVPPSKIRLHAVGAGKEKGSFMFTVSSRDDSSSFRFSAEEARSKGFKQLEVPVVTVQELVEQDGTPVPDMIKIDAEGLDLDVIEGCARFFGRTEVFLVEASVMNNIFSNNVLKVCEHMDARGYKLFDITDLNRPFTSGALWLVELAFIKNGGMIDSYDWRS